jgi:hypothetical protein
MPLFGRSRPDTLRAQVGDVARDLVSIEVNTILKENMTAARMPGVAAALLEIADRYLDWLHRFRVHLEPVWAAQRPTGDAAWPRLPAPDPNAIRVPMPSPLTFGLTFERLGEIARQLGERPSDVPVPGVTGADRFVLHRIERNCTALSALLMRHPGYADREVSVGDAEIDADSFAPPMTTRDLLIVRKIWEVGTEEIVAQTVVTLDGDVTSRLGRRLTDAAGITGEARTLVMALHDRSLDTAMGNWHALARAAASVVSGIVRG